MTRGETLLVVRRLHLYLSVFFAPLLLVFVVTGWAQTMNFDHSTRLMSQLSQVHKRQLFEDRPAGKTGQGAAMKKSLPMKWLVATMAVALIVSISLGLVLAFTMVRNRLPVVIALVLGIATPVLLLALAHFR